MKSNKNSRNSTKELIKILSKFYLSHLSGIDEVPDLALKHMVKFITGTFQVRPIGFPSAIKVKFLHGCSNGCKCRPVASTCSLTLTLPIHSCSSDELGDLLISSLTECGGFCQI